MIQDIITLRNEGLSFREIARALDSTVGKVHYQWSKHAKDLDEHQLIPPTPITEQRNRTTPGSYNLDQIRVMVKDFSTIYIYWELSTIKKSFLEHSFTRSFDHLPKFIKIYDVTSILFNGSNAHRECEISIPEMTNNWFVTDLEPNRTYLADFGVKTDHGEFFTVLRSNSIDTPRNAPEQAGLFTNSVLQWKTGSQQAPDWLEQFSTYSYYERVK
ncbi:DUF4912 domain-containing protein [Bacillus pinisoli]|uniref:DUF4912 domain-containing protein n=1 Tax=Bacillus pinisoli TaxID=2901866 RepID=UPI001FF66760|nr:DUF4912 domain-containing protein [Bacillus pinisoli]